MAKHFSLLSHRISAFPQKFSEINLKRWDASTKGWPIPFSQRNTKKLNLGAISSTHKYKLNHFYSVGNYVHWYIHMMPQIWVFG
jgi:hypothetical protein